jgi:predicted membrane protein
MAIVLIGLYIISHRAYLFGTFVTGIGLFFLIPLFLGLSNWVYKFSPLILVFIGILFIVKLFIPKKQKSDKKPDFMSKDYTTKDGFVYSYNTFSGTKHVVMDEVFKGAKIVNRFGGTALDLRRTTLQPGETFIDVDCKFGGIEIIVPESWLVLTKLDLVMGGVSDERRHFGKIDENYKLVLRGDVSLSGLVLKN